jgi:hypothetical protein
MSHAQSTTSYTSTRPMLADMHRGTSPSLDPTPPFPPSSQSSHTPGNATPTNSLSVNYLPSKFSSTLLAPANPRRRKNAKSGIDGVSLPKRGGGVEAFRSGEARMGESDEDFDATSGGIFIHGGHTKPKLHWNRFKWTLFFSNLCLTTYSIIALVFCLLTWFDVWKHADIVRVGNRPELIISTLAASVGLVTSLIGWSGILLNNRAFLAVYTFLLWVCFGLLVTPGYISYRRRTFNLEGKINAQWSRNLGAEGRLRIQDQLGCCGYFSPFVEATVSATCYSRSILPGCKLHYLQFQRSVLDRWYKVAFALVPLHLFVMVAGLLCSNHVTYRFGKGMMPKAYRLSMNSMAVIMDNYANQLAEQYGEDVASSAMGRSRSILDLNNVPAMQYASSREQVGYGLGKYDSVAGHTSDGAQ